jgi:hypothetical protein
MTWLDNATEYISGCGDRTERCSIVDRVSGKSYGVEFLVKRPIGRRLWGWVSYTLSRAERTFEGQPYLSPFDRTQVFSGVASYDFGRGYRAGLRATYYSGRPDTPTIQFSGQSPSYPFRPGEMPQHRLPDFYRLDLRADKTWAIGQNGASNSLVLEFFNATLTKEAFYWDCGISGECNAYKVGPIALPSIGVEGAL